MGVLSIFRRKKRAVAAPRETKGRRPAPPAASTETTKTVPLGPLKRPAFFPALVSPALTEKATRLQAEGAYTFRVGSRETKPAIRRAIEARYGVHVRTVRVVNLPHKTRRRGKITGRVPGVRKAIVRLRSGERIDLAGPTA